MNTFSPETIRLEGYSGYEVTLLSDRRGNYFVKKKAKRLEQNPRLIAQYKKHVFFASKKNASFSVPEVTGQGYERGLFWYSYRFIEGVTLLHFVETEPLSRVRLALDKTLGVLEAYEKDPVHFESGVQHFPRALNKKISESYERIKDTNLPPNLLKKFKTQARRISYPTAPTLCHGDFTLDNIIVDRDLRLWLIDFVEIFYPHWWFDISKFFQDVDGGWYELTRGVRLQYNKLMYTRDYLLAGIHDIDKRYKPAHSFFVALHLLRNIPFLKNSTHFSAEEAEAKREAVVEKIHALLDHKSRT